MRTFLKVTQVVSPVGMRSVRSKTVLALQTPHREVVGDLPHGKVGGALLAIGAEHQRLGLLLVVGVGTVQLLICLAVSFAYLLVHNRLKHIGVVSVQVCLVG
jgi:hypothetical protein